MQSARPNAHAQRIFGGMLRQNNNRERPFWPRVTRPGAQDAGKKGPRAEVDAEVRE
jgi:hypothetical protein